jgi:hypothetical protein
MAAMTARSTTWSQWSVTPEDARSRGVRLVAAHLFDCAAGAEIIPIQRTEWVMKTFFLHQDVYACRTDDGAVLMDLRSGEYFGLDLVVTAAIAPRIEGWIGRFGPACDQPDTPNSDESARILDFLSEGPGLLTDSPVLGKAVDPPLLQQTDSIPLRGNLVPGPRIRPLHVVRFCSACLHALLQVKCRSLATTVRRVQSRKSCNVRADAQQPQIVELVRVFRFLRPLLYTANDKCLYDSLALVEFLARFGVFPTWVIGVRTRPFAAHSWVLSDNLLLNERLEKAEEYFPLLAV